MIIIKRLTYKDDPDYVPFETNCVNGSYDIWEPEELEAQVHRLWQIEDILGDEYNLDWLREVVEKERAKQTVYPPFGENQ